MSVFMDLNVTSSPATDSNRLQRVIQTAASLGYSTVAINHVFQPSGMKKQEVPKPTAVSELFDQLPIVQGRSRSIRVLNRLTIVVSDSGHFRKDVPEYRSFDLLAVQPTTEKLFHAACTAFDVDIICITVTEKLPFFFKRAPVNVAVERGLVFEVCYVPSIRDSTMRRYSIANAVSLVETCKGKNMILSSGAEKPLELRGPYDIANLGLLFGLSEQNAKEAVSSTCRSALLHAETRKTASGIIYTTKLSTASAHLKGAELQSDEPTPAPEEEQPAAKRAKPAAGDS